MQSREDPWLGLLQWGRRAGRPLGDGETEIEYGRSLAAFIEEKHTREPENSRTAARDVVAMSVDVSAIHYATQPQRATLRQNVRQQWAVVTPVSAPATLTCQPFETHDAPERLVNAFFGDRTLF